MPNLVVIGEEEWVEKPPKYKIWLNFRF